MFGNGWWSMLLWDFWPQWHTKNYLYSTIKWGVSRGLIKLNTYSGM